VNNVFPYRSQLGDLNRDPKIDARRQLVTLRNLRVASFTSVQGAAFKSTHYDRT
jgi:hypothetical protein